MAEEHDTAAKVGDAGNPDRQIDAAQPASPDIGHMARVTPELPNCTRWVTIAVLSAARAGARTPARTPNGTRFPTGTPVPLALRRGPHHRLPTDRTSAVDGH